MTFLQLLRLPPTFPKNVCSITSRLQILPRCECECEWLSYFAGAIVYCICSNMISWLYVDLVFRVLMSTLHKNEFDTSDKKLTRFRHFSHKAFKRTLLSEETPFILHHWVKCHQETSTSSWAGNRSTYLASWYVTHAHTTYRSSTVSRWRHINPMKVTVRQIHSTTGKV